MTDIRLAELRRAAGLTQEQLACASGMSGSYLALIERGLRRINQDTLGHLAAALGVRPSDLIDDGEVPEKIRAHIDLLCTMDAASQALVFNYCKLLAESGIKKLARTQSQ